MTQRPLKQKLIGILGGCSNVATKEYYDFLNNQINKAFGGWEIAETMIAGMNFGNIEAYVRSGDWQGLESYLKTKVGSLEKAEVDILLCASNTIHKVLEPIVEGRSFEFIHICDPTAEAIKEKGLKKVALFGTKPVMELDYLKNYYAEKHGVEVCVPSEKEQIEIDRIIFEELVKEKIKESSRKYYLTTFNRLNEQEGAEGLILGCTEIFLLLPPSDYPKENFFNTAELHCLKAVKKALA